MTDFETFARAELPGLLRYSVMLTGEPHQAADLVQDVLVKAHRHWGRISGTERPQRYVMRMVTNQYLSWRRSWAVRQIVPRWDLPDRPADDDLAGHHAARDEMWHRLATLPRRQRAVLVLRYYQQLTDHEIAEVLGCTSSTVRGYAHRALAALRADLAAELAPKESR